MWSEIGNRRWEAKVGSESGKWKWKVEVEGWRRRLDINLEVLAKGWMWKVKMGMKVESKGGWKLEMELWVFQNCGL